MAKKKAAPAKKTITMKIPATRKNPQPAPPPVEQTRKPLDLEIGIKDFGPISSGKIKLKPLTVLIGPNNSGKSYTAMLIHALNNVRPSVGYSTYEENMKKALNDYFQLKQNKQLMMNCAPKQTFSIDIKPILDMMLTPALFRITSAIRRAILHVFSSDFNALIASGSTSFNVIVSKKDISIDWLVTERTKMKDVAFNIDVLKKPGNTKIVVKKISDNIVKVTSAFGRETGREGLIVYDRISDFIKHCFFSLFETSFESRYLPSARSGLLQGYKATVAETIKHIPLLINIENEEGKNIETTIYSGAVADFLSSLVTLPKEKGAYYDLAHSLEQEMLNGEIVIDSDKYRTPEFLFQMEPGNTIPLHRASSTVSEIAPLIIYLKHIVKPGELLIIEEPEAHLHPANQRILAKYLVRLIRQGVNILITTHSEYMLDQINNFILASKIGEKARTKKNLGLGKDDYLNADEVGAYVFKKNKRGGGFKIEQVETTDEDGISEEEFLKVLDTMYEETIILRRQIEQQEEK